VQAQSLKLGPNNCPELPEALKRLQALRRVDSLSKRLLVAISAGDLGEAEGLAEEVSCCRRCCL
jgi:hypothetical protein